MAASAASDAGPNKGRAGVAPSDDAAPGAASASVLSGHARKTPDTLALRVASSAVLAPATILACWIGGPAFAGLIGFLMVAMCFEWSRMVEREELTSAFYALAIPGALAVAAAASGGFALAYGLAALAGACGWLAARGGARAWIAFAAIYVCAPSIALLWLREGGNGGRGLTLLLFAIVWAADIGGYFFGRMVGGPRLSPVLSPAKTWAGAVGGVLLGGAAGLVGGGFVFGDGDALAYVAIGGALGLSSIVGDMVESGVKRHFGIKDMSGFIPGHGGALDRLDGMIFATSAIALVLYGHMLLGRL